MPEKINLEVLRPRYTLLEYVDFMEEKKILWTSREKDQRKENQITIRLSTLTVFTRRKWDNVLNTQERK